MHMSFIFSKILCCWNQLSVLWLPGNREGKIFVWELQSSPPVLIARLICFSLHVKYNPQSVYWWPYILLYISGCLMLSQNLPLDRLPCPMMEGNLNIRFSLRKSWVLLVLAHFPFTSCDVWLSTNQENGDIHMVQSKWKGEMLWKHPNTTLSSSNVLWCFY